MPKKNRLFISVLLIILAIVLIFFVYKKNVANLVVNEYESDFKFPTNYEECLSAPTDYNRYIDKDEDTCKYSILETQTAVDGIHPEEYSKMLLEGYNYCIDNGGKFEQHNIGFDGMKNKCYMIFSAPN